MRTCCVESLRLPSQDPDVSSLLAMMIIIAWVGTCLVRITVARMMRGYRDSDDDDNGVGNDDGDGGDDIDIVLSVS